MPDNSTGTGLKRTYKRLPPGRFPERMKPTVPYRIEEWGKSRTYLMPAEFGSVLRSSPRSFPVGWDKWDRSKVARRGAPSLGALAVYIGEGTKAPIRESELFPVRVVKEGFARTEKEAQDRADAWIRQRLAERVGKARRRRAVPIVQNPAR